MSRFTRVGVLFMLLVIFALFVVPVASAQDATPVIPALDLNGLAQAFLVFVFGAFGAWVASPATVAIVGILKRYVFTQPPEQGGIGGDTLALVVGVVLAALTALLAHLGFEQQWRTALEIAVGFMTVLTGIGLNLTQAGKTYEKAKVQNAPITGFSRITGNDTPSSVQPARAYPPDPHG